MCASRLGRIDSDFLDVGLAHNRKAALTELLVAWVDAAILRVALGVKVPGGKSSMHQSKDQGTAKACHTTLSSVKLKPRQPQL